MHDEFRPQILAVAAYLAQVADPHKKRTVDGWFADLPDMFDRIRQPGYGEVEYVPEIRVCDTDAVGAEGARYAIYVNRGHIDYCYSLGPEIFSCVDDQALRWVTLNPVSSLAFRWTIAHEFFHGARAHNDIAPAEASRGLHDSDAIARATEYDADLCATAHIYRLVQCNLFVLLQKGRLSSFVSDIGMRQVTLCALFATLRLLPEPPGQSHLTRAERLSGMVGKLATIGFNRTDPVADLSLPETRNRLMALWSCLLRCEDQFQARHGTEYGDLATEIHKHFESENCSAHVEAWGSLYEAQRELFRSDRREPFGKAPTGSFSF